MNISKTNLDKELNILKQIDYILPKLKYSVSVSKIVKWLNNFEEKDIFKAIDVLFFLEYIDFYDLTFRLNDNLEKVFQLVPSTNNVIIFPGATQYPKSPELINYIIKDTLIYKKHKDKITITRNIDDIEKVTVNTSLILTDDIVGSGKSFEEGYDTKSNIKAIIDQNNWITDRFLVAAIIMANGKEYIEKNYPEVKIYAENKNSIFHSDTSPFRIKNNLVEIHGFAQSYGAKLCKSAPLGYSNTEALIAFCHTSPNNTLPIIWSNKNNWFPIFPRFAIDKIQQSKDFKTEVAFYIGLMNRLGLDLYTNETIKIKGKRDIRYNKFKDHSLLCITKLMIDSYEKPAICQIIGITISEYNKIIEYGKSKGVFDDKNKLSDVGREFYHHLMAKIKNKRYLKSEKANFEMKYVNYIPKCFGGAT